MAAKEPRKDSRNYNLNLPNGTSVNLGELHMAASRLDDMKRECWDCGDIGDALIQRLLGFLYALAHDREGKSMKYMVALNPERDVPLLQSVGLLDENGNLPDHLKPALAVMLKKEKNKYGIRQLLELQMQGAQVVAVEQSGDGMATGKDNEERRRPAAIPLKNGFKIEADVIEQVDSSLKYIALELSEHDPQAFQDVLCWLKDAAEGQQPKPDALPAGSLAVLEASGILEQGVLPYTYWDAVATAVVEDIEQDVPSLKIRSLYDQVCVGVCPTEKAASEPAVGTPGTDVDRVSLYRKIGLEPPDRGNDVSDPGVGR